MKMFNTKDFHCLQAIFEARITPPLIAVEKLEANQIAKKARDFLELQNYIDGKEVHFQNSNDKITCGVLTDKIGMAANENPSLDKFRNYIKKFVPLATGVLDVSKFSRVGFRTVFILPKENMSEANNTLYEISILTEQIIKSIGTLNNFLLRVSTVKSGIVSNITITPGQSQSIEVNPQGTKIQSFQGLFIDIDLFTENVTTVQNLGELLDNILKYLRNDVFPMLNNIEVEK